MRRSLNSGFSCELFFEFGTQFITRAGMELGTLPYGSVKEKMSKSYFLLLAAALGGEIILMDLVPHFHAISKTISYPNRLMKIPSKQMLNGTTEDEV